MYENLKAIPDAHLIEIASVYLQLIQIHDSLQYIWKEDNDPLFKLIGKLIELAGEIEPKTLEGCAAKFTIAFGDTYQHLNKYTPSDRLQVDAVITAKRIITNSDN